MLIEIINYLGNLSDTLQANSIKIAALYFMISGACAHVAAGWAQPSSSFLGKVHNVVNLLAANYGQAKNANKEER